VKHSSEMLLLSGAGADRIAAAVASDSLCRSVCYAASTTTLLLQLRCCCRYCSSSGHGLLLTGYCSRHPTFYFLLQLGFGAVLPQGRPAGDGL
jgi:hypothetical protein